LFEHDGTRFHTGFEQRLRHRFEPGFVLARASSLY
jgi:hypothetical protein